MLREGVYLKRDPERGEDRALSNSLSYQLERVDTKKQADATMPDGRGPAFLASALNTAIFEPAESLGKGIFAFALSSLGDKVEKGKVDAFIGNSLSLLSNLDKVPEGVQNKLDEYTLLQAKAYLEGDSKTIGRLEGEIFGTIAGLGLLGGGAGNVGKVVGAAEKTGKGLGEAANAAKLLDRVAETSTVAKDAEGAANAVVDAASVNAQSPISTKLSALENAQENAAIAKALPDGRIRYYSEEIPAKTEGSTRGASYVTEWNPETGQVRSWMESYDQAGSVVRVHPKMIDGQTVNASHYPPTSKELGR